MPMIPSRAAELIEWGKVDSDTQLENLRKARAAAEAPMNFYKQKYDTTGILAFKLGVVMGIAAMILAA